MSQPLYPPSGPQSIGQVLDTAFRMFQVSIAKCLPHGVLSMLAGQLPNIYYLAAGKPIPPFGSDPSWWALYVVGMLASFTLWSAMLLRQVSIVRREAPHLRAEFLEALRRLPELFALSVLALLIIAIGVVALVIPALYFAVALLFAWPAMLFEGRGPVSAIRYSLNLTKGSWWRASAALTVAFVVALVFYIVTLALMGILLQLFGANDVALLTAASVVVVIALGAIGVPFYGATLLALYGDLKLRKEGTDLAGRLAGMAQA